MSDRPDYWSFTFSIDPSLNEGFTKAFNQGGEPWWWFISGDQVGPAAAGPPDMRGAKCISVHNHEKKVWSA